MYSPDEATTDIFSLQKNKALELRTEPLQNRKQRLKKLSSWIHANRPAIHAAMHEDFRKHPVEVDGIEIFHVLSEIKNALDNLDHWTADKKVDAPLTMLGTRSYIHYEPRGVCLIISPWNYPFALCVGPLIAALAAGNAVILKPSELAAHVSAVIKRMTEEVFESSVVFAAEGGAATSKHLLTLPFDHIFFTGSPEIGKIVMKAGAEQLASVTLELGGKCPSIVTEHASLKAAAQRTAAAKFVNNGQTCVAPDYVLVHEKVAEQFAESLVKEIHALFTEKGESFQQSVHYCRIISDKHFLRLSDLLQDALIQGATVSLSGKNDQKERFFHPTILTNVPRSCRIMNEEIFGPILPIITYSRLEEAIRFVNEKPKPLGLYIFSGKKKEQRKIIMETSSGGVCINDNAIQFLHHNLPFGGVNNSGIGRSHGYAGFLAFSNERPVLRQPKRFSVIKVFYPPYTTLSRKLMNWFLKRF